MADQCDSPSPLLSPGKPKLPSGLAVSAWSSRTSWRWPVPNLPAGVPNQPVVTLNSFSMTPRGKSALLTTFPWSANVFSYRTQKSGEGVLECCP